MEFDEMRVNFLKMYSMGSLQALRRYYDKLVESQ